MVRFCKGENMKKLKRLGKGMYNKKLTKAQMKRRGFTKYDGSEANMRLSKDGRVSGRGRKPKDKIIHFYK